MSLSPNFGPRRGDARPELVVLHYTAMACDPARARLCDPAHEVSAHWLISEQGEVIALVPEEMRAWHAGAGSWQGRADVNSRSIGIELANLGTHPFAHKQIQALEALLADILARWQIAPEAVIAHSDMAPERKIDPGPRFDWRALAHRGLSIWPAPQAKLPPDPRQFAALASSFGYPDCPFDTLLAAFRLRFRPSYQGPLDGFDMAQAADLAARFGQDGGPWRAA